MNDTPLHTLYNTVNSKPRNDVKSVIDGMKTYNNKLAEKHFIQESSSTQNEIVQSTFEKMTKIKEIIAQRDLSNYLGATLLEKQSLLKKTKDNLKEAIDNQNKDNVVDDMIR